MFIFGSVVSRGNYEVEWVEVHLLCGKSAFETSFDNTNGVSFSSLYYLFRCSVATVLIYIMPITGTVLR